MALIFGLNRRRKDRNARHAAKSERHARQEEEARQQQLRRDEMERAIFQTAEGQGIQEQASISLGFDEDEDDLFGMNSGTGLVI